MRASQPPTIPAKQGLRTPHLHRHSLPAVLYLDDLEAGRRLAKAQEKIVKLLGCAHSVVEKEVEGLPPV